MPVISRVLCSTKALDWKLTFMMAPHLKRLQWWDLWRNAPHTPQCNLIKVGQFKRASSWLPTFTHHHPISICALFDHHGRLSGLREGSRWTLKNSLLLLKSHSALAVEAGTAVFGMEDVVTTWGVRGTITQWRRLCKGKTCFRGFLFAWKG